MLAVYAVLRDTKGERYSAGAPKALIACTDRISVETMTARRGHHQAGRLTTMVEIAFDLRVCK
jgi:hypothetical protein